MSSSIRSILVLLAVTAVAGSMTAVPVDQEPRLVRGSGGDAPIGEELDGLAGDDALGEAGESGGPGESASGEGREVTRTRVGGGSGGVAAGAGATGSGGSAGSGGSGGAAAGTVECAPGRNGGATDEGVTSDSIGLASTIVTSGPGSTFLGESQFGMQAVRAKVNAAGGICGRRLELKLVNDNWEAQRGHNILRNFMNSGEVFALPVVPSSEGLQAAGPDIENAGMPVVGSDGMLIEQYKNPWIWPVATATVSQMRIVAKYAYDQGARKFAIVHDEFYKFGEEGKNAYQAYVQKLKGQDSEVEFVHAEGIQPNQPGYGPHIDNLNQACGSDGCDVVTMLVDPGTANTWIAGDENFVNRAEFRFGAQPLFSENFAQDCGARCDGMIVVSGYVPPLGSNTGLPGVKEYIQDVQNVKPDADVTNQFLEGAYLGMSVFVEALREVGPNLTRARVREAMNSMTHQSDLASDLTWTASRRKANQAAQAWQINAGSGSFDGFQYLRTGWLKDPDPSAD